MFCNNCGTQLPDNAKFCSSCGNSIQTVNFQKAPTLNSHLPPTQQVNPLSISKNVQRIDEYLSLFVGQKYHSYYRKAWFGGKPPTLETNKARKFTFNWAGFFLGFIWLCYRKTYFVAALIAIGLTVIDLIKMHKSSPYEYNAFGSLSVSLLGLVFSAIMGNFFYYEHCVGKVKKIISAYGSDEYMLKSQLVQQGGTTTGGAIGMSLLLFLLIILMYAFFAPRWVFV